MKLGERVKELLFQQGRSAMWLAEQLHCERTNVYDIFRRDDMGIELLRRISLALSHDFFKELSEETFPPNANN